MFIPSNLNGGLMARLLALVGVSMFLATTAYAAAPVDADGDGYFVESSPVDDTEKVPAEKTDCDDDNILSHPGASELLAADDVDNNCDGVDDATAKEAYLARLTERVPEGEKRDAAVAAWEAAIGGCIDATYTDEVDGAVWRIGKPMATVCAVLNEDGTVNTAYAWDGKAAEMMNRPTSVAYRRAGAASKAAAGAASRADEALLILRGDDDNRGLIATVGDLTLTVYGVDVDGNGRTDDAGDKLGLVDAVSGLRTEMYYGVDTNGDSIVDRKAVLGRLDALEADSSVYRRALFGADGLDDNKGGLDGDVASLQSSYGLIARNGFSLYGGLGGGIGAQPMLDAVVCGTFNENFECLEDGTVNRTVRGGGLLAGGGSLGVAYNWEDWRFSVLASQSATVEGGEDASGDSKSYEGSVTRGDVAVVHQLPAVPAVYLGGYLDFYHHESGSTPISTRVTGNGGGAGLAGRYEIPVRGPVELGFEGGLGLGYEKFGSTITDPTASWDVIQEGVTFDSYLRFTVGLGPMKR